MKYRTRVKYADIKPDTSLYRHDPERSIALAKVIQAKEGGAAVEGRFKDEATWSEEGLGFSDLLECEYRVKPEPVVTQKTEWKLYVPRVGGYGAYDHPANWVGTFKSRAVALGRAEEFVGFALIAQEVVTYHDGVEVSREVRR